MQTSPEKDAQMNREHQILTQNQQGKTTNYLPWIIGGVLVFCLLLYIVFGVLGIKVV
jgi:hypothetical protein